MTPMEKTKTVKQTVTFTDIYYNNTKSAVTFSKTGNLVNASCAFHKNSLSGWVYSDVKVPVEFRPGVTIYASGVDAYGTGFLISVQPNGTIGIYRSTSVDITSGYSTICWFTDEIPFTELT